MKVAIVAGFFDPVRDALGQRFAKQLEVSSLLWIRQAGIGRELNIPEFSSALSRQLANGARELLVIVAVLQGQRMGRVQGERDDSACGEGLRGSSC